MTTIAASRLHGQMAGDTLITYGNMSFPTHKIQKIGDLLVGAAGLLTDCTAFYAWLRAGRPEDKPELNSDEGFDGMVLDHTGLWVFDTDCCAVRVERDYHAIGSGAQAAMAAMLCGRTPKRALEIACALDSSSGKPIDVISL